MCYKLHMIRNLAFPYKKILKIIFIGVVALILFNSVVGTVGAGQRGIVTRFGAVTGKVYGEGLYFKFPIVEQVVKMDVKIQKEQVEASAASKDLQTVNTIIALNFRLKAAEVDNVYQNVGISYKERIIDPALQEAVKASTAKFTAEELITKREEVKETIKSHLRVRLTPIGIEVEELNIVDFQFSIAFDQAIESKVTAEQNALAAQNKLKQIEFEAEQNIAEARGKAEAIRIESQALANNPAVLELRAIEKWNGILPSVTSGAVPFININ